MKRTEKNWRRVKRTEKKLWNCNWRAWYSQNTEKSPENFRKLAVTQNPAKDHQLTREWKICKEFCHSDLKEKTKRKERKRKDCQVFGHCQRTKTKAEHLEDCDTYCNWSTWKAPQGDWRNCKSEEESRPSRLENRWDRLEYLWEHRWPEESCC